MEKKGESMLTGEKEASNETGMVWLIYLKTYPKPIF